MMFNFSKEAQRRPSECLVSGKLMLPADEAKEGAGFSAGLTAGPNTLWSLSSVSTYATKIAI